MSLKDKRAKRREPLMRARAFERKKLMRIINNRYSYVVDSKEGKGLPFRYLETIVGQYGRAAIYKDKNYGIAVYKAVVGGNYDIYGIPTKYTLYTRNGMNIKTVDADDENLIIIKDTFNADPLSLIADEYATLLGKIRETISTNVSAMRTPFIITTDKDNVLNVKMAMEAINNSPEVIIDQAKGFDENKNSVGGISVLNLDTPNNLESLEIEYHNVLSRFLEDIGFSSILITKKERLVSAEADANGSTLLANDNESFENRLEFVTKMKTVFNIDLKLVKSNIDIYRDYGATTESRPFVDSQGKPVNTVKPTKLEPKET